MIRGPDISVLAKPLPKEELVSGYGVSNSNFEFHKKKKKK